MVVSSLTATHSPLWRIWNLGVLEQVKQRLFCLLRELNKYFCQTHKQVTSFLALPGISPQFLRFQRKKGVCCHFHFCSCFDRFVREPGEVSLTSCSSFEMASFQERFKIALGPRGYESKLTYRSSQLVSSHLADSASLLKPACDEVYKVLSCTKPADVFQINSRRCVLSKDVLLFGTKQ